MYAATTPPLSYPPPHAVAASPGSDHWHSVVASTIATRAPAVAGPYFVMYPESEEDAVMAGASADATADLHCFVFGRDEFNLPMTRPGTRIPPMEASATRYTQRTCLPLDGVCKGAPQIVELRTRDSAAGPWRYVASAILERSLIDAAAFYVPQTSLTRSEVGTIATGAWEFRFLRTQLRRVALIQIAYHDDRECAQTTPAAAPDSTGVITLDSDDSNEDDIQQPPTPAVRRVRPRSAAPSRPSKRARAYLDSCGVTGGASDDENEDELDCASDADEDGNLAGFIDDAPSEEDSAEEEEEEEDGVDIDDDDYGDASLSDDSDDAPPAPRAARPARAAKRNATLHMSHMLRINGGRIPGYDSEDTSNHDDDDDDDEYYRYEDDAMAEEVDEDDIDLEEEERLARTAARRIERMRSSGWRRRAGASTAHN